MNCLVILAAGLGSRFGGAKQLVEFGPLQRTLMEYNICHAYDAGFRKVVLVVQAASRMLIENQILPRLPKDLKVHIVEQNNQRLPNQQVELESFNKPLGTAHALWCAKPFLESDFSVINGDDYYSSKAFRLLANPSQCDHAAIVAFHVDRTLSDYGGVNRGICDVIIEPNNSREYLTGVRECIDIKREGKMISGSFKFGENRVENNQRIILNESDLVSMNCWRFKHSFIALLESEIERHFKDLNSPSECFLPDVVMQSIKRDSASYIVEKSSQAWFGLTYKEDQRLVDKNVTELTSLGAFKTLELIND